MKMIYTKTKAQSLSVPITFASVFLRDGSFSRKPSTRKRFSLCLRASPSRSLAVQRHLFVLTPVLSSWESANEYIYIFPPDSALMPRWTDRADETTLYVPLVRSKFGPHDGRHWKLALEVLGSSGQRWTDGRLLGSLPRSLAGCRSWPLSYDPFNKSVLLEAQKIVVVFLN